MTTQTAIKLKLGRIVATPAALAVLGETGTHPSDLLDRHVTGDWGDLDEHDKVENDFAVNNNQRILSSYVLPAGDKVWIITEWDRSVTTVLLPEDY